MVVEMHGTIEIFLADGVHLTDFYSPHEMRGCIVFTVCVCPSARVYRYCEHLLHSKPHSNWTWGPKTQVHKVWLPYHVIPASGGPERHIFGTFLRSGSVKNEKYHCLLARLSRKLWFLSPAEFKFRAEFDSSIPVFLNLFCMPPACAQCDVRSA